MNTFIENNKKFFKFYYAVIRISSWFLLTFGVGGFVIWLIIVRNIGLVAAFKTPLRSPEFTLFGLFGLGIAQLIRCLIDHDYRSDFIMRHGEKFIYAYVLVMFILTILRNIVMTKNLSDAESATQSVYWGITIGSFILFTAQASILIGAAQFLKRMMPVIEEQRTLV